MPDIFQATQALTNHDGQTALDIFQKLESEDPNIVQEFAELAHIIGLAHYELDNFNAAINSFVYSLSREARDDTTQFYIGNCFLRFRQFKKARTCFENALKVRKFFPEARNNLAITIQSILQGHVKKSDWDRIDWHMSHDLNFDVENSDSCFEIPIFINNRDRVGCLSKLLDWLLESGYRRIFILDQDSTYPPLLEFYETFRRDQRVHVFRMENWGFRAIWRSQILEQLNIQTPYVYTDSDILPICEKNIVQELLRTMKKYPLIKKVAPRINVDQITTLNATSIQLIEAEKFDLNRQIAPNEFFLPSDTTFAVYHDARYYNLIYSIIRSDIQILHLPWSYDVANLPEDEKYYIEHSNSNSTFAQTIKNQSSSSLNL